MESVYPHLELEIRKRHISYSKLASEIGLSKTALYRRVNGITDFKLSEIVRICQFLENFDVSWLFLRLDTKT